MLNFSVLVCLTAAAVAMFLFTFLASRNEQRERSRRLQLRTDLVERALESGAIDESTKRELLDVVTGKVEQARKDAAKEAGVGAGSKTLFVLGWLGLFAGLGMLTLHLLEAGDYWFIPAILTSTVGFGALSMPLAMRELHARRELGRTSEVKS